MSHFDAYRDSFPNARLTRSAAVAGRREKSNASARPHCRPEMPANRAHLCAWLSVSFGQMSKKAAKYRIDSVACLCS